MKIEKYICIYECIRYIHTKSPEWPTENIFQSQPSKIKVGTKKLEVMRSSAAQWGVKLRDGWRNGTQDSGFQSGK